MELKLLNKIQEEQVSKLLSYYKYLFICNTCGSVYGSDALDKKRECPICESARELKESKKCKRK